MSAQPSACPTPVIVRVFFSLAMLLFLAPTPQVFAKSSWQAGGVGSAATNNLSNSPEFVSRYSSIAADCAGRVHVIWFEEDGGESDLHSINYTAWDGLAWREASSILVAWNVLLPSLTVDPSGNLHLVYMSGSWLYYSRTAGDPPWSALSWSQPVPVGQKSDDEYLHWHELISDPAGNLHLIYVNWRGESQMAYSQVFYTGLRANEEGWSDPVRLSDPTAWAGFVGSSNIISDPKGALYALWMEAVPPYHTGDLSNITFARSTDAGRSWSPAQPLSSPDPAFNEPIGLAAPAPGQVHALWYRELHDVVYAASSDGGESWSGASTIYTSSGDITRYGAGALASDSAGGVHLFLPLDRQDIFYMRWTGQGWLPPVNISADPVNPSYWPRAAVALGNELHLIWNKGYAELALPDLEQRLAAGQYEILHKGVHLDTPALPVACKAVQPVTKPTVRPTAEAPAPKPLAPAPTPGQNQAVAQDPAPARGSDTLPIILGSGLSAVLVLSVVVVRLIRKR